MTHDDQIERPLDRRLLLRGGAVLAGAAGVTVVGAALGPAAAQAADGSTVLSGKANASENTTVLTIDGTIGGPAPALSLVNKNGPGLRLSSVPDSWDDTLAVGELAGTDFGPLVGVDYGGDPGTTYLLTADDLTLIPATVPRKIPKRLLDTRNAAGREGIVQKSSATAINTAGQLTAGSWIEILVDSAVSTFELTGVFVNLTAVSPVASGYTTVYPPGDRPNTSTVNFRATITLSNSAFVGLGVNNGNYVVRVYSSQTTHMLLDYSGAVVSGSTETTVAASSAEAKRRSARQAKRRSAMKAKLSRKL